MNWLYPKVRNFKQIPPYLFFGSVAAGLYGAIHDQLSYTISNEYFTRFKFYQFHYADFDLPDRFFVGIIGFLATGCVGMIVSWFLARIRFNSDHLDSARKDILRGFAIVSAAAVLTAIAGGIVGYARAFYFPLEGFFGWESVLTEAELKNFVIVGFIHNFG